MWSAALAIGLFNIPVFTRISCASACAIWPREFVQAARVCGKSRWQITREHILPHVLPVLIVQASTQFAVAILAEAALVLFGAGHTATTAQLGRMLADAQTLLYQRPMLVVYPGASIAIAVLGLNLLGDARAISDPKTQEQVRP